MACFRENNNETSYPMKREEFVEYTISDYYHVLSKGFSAWIYSFST
jgi:hypothetical protein